MLIVKRVERNKARAFGTTVCGVDLRFDFLSHENETVLGCYLIASDEKCDEIARTLAKVPRYDVFRGAVKPVQAPTYGRFAGDGPPRTVSILFELGLVTSIEPHDLSADEQRKLRLLQELVEFSAAELNRRHRPPVEETHPQRGSGFFESRTLPPESEPSPVYLAARANGWGAEDLLGTGGPFGDPGPVGGYSALTGLTVAQMALSVPPDGWDDAKRLSVYPWEVEGWKRPGLDWVPPAVPSKAPLTKAVDQREADLLHGRTPKADRPEAMIDPDGPHDVQPGDIDGLDAYNEGLESGTIRELSPTESDAVNERLGAVDPAIAAGYPAEHLDAVRRMVHVLAAAAAEAGKPLHHNKVNWAIRNSNEEHNLAVPTVTGDQLTALLAVPPTPAP